MAEPQFLSAVSLHPNPAHAAGELAGALIEHSEWGAPELVLVFASARHAGSLEDLVEAVRVICEPTNIVGAVASGVIGKSFASQQRNAIAIWAAWNVNTDVRLIHTTSDDSRLFIFDDPNHDYEHALLIADPFSFDADSFLKTFQSRTPGVQIHGGYTSAARSRGGNKFVVNESSQSTGAALIFLDGVCKSLLVRSARPIGQPLAITGYKEGGIIESLGGAPAMERLEQIAAEANEIEKELLLNGVLIGQVVVNSPDAFVPDDFHVFQIAGIDRTAGSIRCEHPFEIGDVVQFHGQDPMFALALLKQKLAQVSNESKAALMFSSAGEVSNLFSIEHEEIELIEEVSMLPNIAGFYSAGEFSPLGEVNRVHQTSTTVVLFA